VSRPHLLRQAPRSAAADVRLNPLRSSGLTLVRYTLKSMKLLIELLSNGNDDVQEQASCATCPSRCEITSRFEQVHHRLRRVRRRQHEGLQASDPAAFQFRVCAAFQFRVCAAFQFRFCTAYQFRFRVSPFAAGASAVSTLCSSALRRRRRACSRHPRLR
jgi:hypothetical protein